MTTAVPLALSLSASWMVKVGTFPGSLLTGPGIFSPQRLIVVGSAPSNKVQTSSGSAFMLFLLMAGIAVLEVACVAQNSGHSSSLESAQGTRPDSYGTVWQPTWGVAAVLQGNVH